VFFRHAKKLTALLTAYCSPGGSIIESLNSIPVDIQDSTGRPTLIFFRPDLSSCLQAHRVVWYTFFLPSRAAQVTTGQPDEKSNRLMPSCKHLNVLACLPGEDFKGNNGLRSFPQRYSSLHLNVRTCLRRSDMKRRTNGIR